MAKNFNKVMGREAFLSKRSLTKEFVEIENGTGFYIREMTGADVEYIAKRANDENKPSNVESMAIVIVLSACNEEGNLLFTMEDVPEIVKNISVGSLIKLSEVAVRISKLNPTALNEAKNNLKNG